VQSYGKRIVSDAYAVTEESSELASSSARSAAGAVPRRLDVLAALTYSDLHARYGRGPWQFAKWLLDPFALLGVYLLLVTFVVARPGTDPGLSIACAVIPFQLLMSTVITSMSAVSSRKSIILNMAFDRTLLPVSAALTETFAFFASFALFALMMIVYRTTPTVAMLWLPLVILVNIVLALGFAYPASLFGLWFRDLRVLAVSLVRTLFFLAPGLVALSQVHGRSADILRVNPLTGLFESYRDVFIYGQRPAVWQLLYPLVFGLALLAAFLPLYRREQSQFAKVVE
jgi:ABC-2 type transport system permease protein